MDAQTAIDTDALQLENLNLKLRVLELEFVALKQQRDQLAAQIEAKRADAPNKPRRK